MNIFKKIENLIDDYTTYPASFEGYQWFKPILVGIVAFILFVVLSYLPNLFIGADFDFATWGKVISNYFVIIYIPCIFLAAMIVRDRPFSSYLSSVRGWKWGVFLKSFIVALCIVILFTVVDVVMNHQSLDLSAIGLVLVLSLILVPFQCFAEELLFRGFLMQTVGSWFRIPIIAIIIQAILFAYTHSYDILGMAAVLGSGLVLGIAAWYSKGLEVSTAMHTSNNLITTLSSAILISTASGHTIVDTIMMIAQMAIIFAAIYLLDKKFGWFD